MDLEDLEIIVGTYEEFLLGYQVLQQDNEVYDLAQSFATHSHRASIRSLAAGGKFVASGGSDESIFLYDMTTRKEVGLLMQHHGTVSCLEFAPNGTHLLSGSEDGSIGASRTGNWQLEKLWGKAHKGSAVSSVSIHPSGKLFLSVGVDGTVRTWNFIKGRPAYTTHLCKLKDGRSVTQVMWSPNGETYSVLIGNRVEVFSVTGASIVYTIQLDTKITCISYVNADILCVASEDGQVFLYNIQEKTVIGQFEAHEGRVRCLKSFKLEYVVSASSTGQIKLWCIKDPKNVLQLCEISTGCRITCMTLVNIKNSSENTLIHLLKQNMPGMKVELGVPVKSKPRPKDLGVVTVEVDEPSGTSVKIKKEKNKIKNKKTPQDSTTVKSHATDPTLANNTNEIHKKKKRQDVVTMSLNGEQSVDNSEVQSENLTLNTRTKKKKSQRKEEVQNETVGLPNTDRNAKRKIKRQVSEEVEVMFVDQERKNEKSKSPLQIVIKDKSAKRNRKEPLSEEPTIIEDKSAKRKRRKESLSEEADVLTTKQQRGENKLKKSKKQKTVSGFDSIDSSSGKWIAE